MLQRRGNHSLSMVSNQTGSAYQSESLRLKWFLVEKPSKRLPRLLRKAHGVWRESHATTLGAYRQERW
jgi:hypothetical protein